MATAAAALRHHHAHIHNAKTTLSFAHTQVQVKQIARHQVRQNGFAHCCVSHRIARFTLQVSIAHEFSMSSVLYIYIYGMGLWLQRHCATNNPYIHIYISCESLGCSYIYISGITLIKRSCV